MCCVAGFDGTIEKSPRRCDAYDKIHMNALWCHVMSLAVAEYLHLPYFVLPIIMYVPTMIRPIEFPSLMSCRVSHRSRPSLVRTWPARSGTSPLDAPQLKVEHLIFILFLFHTLPIPPYCHLTHCLVFTLVDIHTVQSLYCTTRLQFALRFHNIPKCKPSMLTIFLFQILSSFLITPTVSTTCTPIMSSLSLQTPALSLFSFSVPNQPPAYGNSLTTICSTAALYVCVHVYVCAVLLLNTLSSRVLVPSNTPSSTLYLQSASQIPVAPIWHLATHSLAFIQHPAFLLYFPNTRTIPTVFKHYFPPPLLILIHISNVCSLEPIHYHFLYMSGVKLGRFAFASCHKHYINIPISILTNDQCSHHATNNHI